MPRNAGRYQPPRVLAVGVVEGHMLFGERDHREQGRRLFEFRLGLALPFHGRMPVILALVIMMPVLPGVSFESVGRYEQC